MFVFLPKAVENGRQECYNGGRIIFVPDESIARGLEKSDLFRRNAKGNPVSYEIAEIGDGGEGTGKILTKALGGSFVKATVHSPVFDKKIEAEYGICGKTAIVEVAAAIGIALVGEKKRRPGDLTSYGAGELILDGLDRGCDRFLISLGGSATNDCGLGALQALGFRFLSSDKKSVPFGAKGIKNVALIDLSHADPRLSRCTFTLLCDVKNPLCGEVGCSRTFGKQKGATESEIKETDEAMRSFSALAAEVLGQDRSKEEGSGAAGGLGFAFSSFLHAEIRRGIDFVTDAIGLKEKIAGSDLVITGEGKTDGQTAMGKAPAGIAKLAKKYGKPVIALCGTIGENADLCRSAGIDAFFSCLREPVPPEKAIEKEYAIKNLTSLSEQIFNALNLL